MPIDDLYADSTSSFLTGTNQLDVPTPRITPSTNIALAVGRGVGQGSAALFGAAADLTAGLADSGTVGVLQQGAAINPDLLAAADSAVNAGANKFAQGHLFESRAGAAAYDLADTLKPDPTKTTAIDQVVQGAVSGLTQIVPATIVAGPIAGAALAAGSIGMQRAEDLKRQGVDVGTRTAVGAVEGAAAAAGGVLPVAGSTLARTAALVAAGGPGLAVTQAAAERAILRNAGYNHLADQIDPLDPVNLAAATIVPAVIGGGHLALQARAARGAAPSGDLTSMPLATRKGLQYNDPAIDAYAVQAAQANGVPPSLMLALKNAGEKSNPTAVSPKGAAGVAQLMPENQAKFGVTDPHDPVQSLDGMAKYLAATMKQYDGNVQAVIADYNGGPAAARAVMAGAAPPHAETAAYLRRVNDYLQNAGIDHLAFNPTPDQVDAALLARGQRVVDDANPLAADDVVSMQSHQDAFEVAARQMNDGGLPDVGDLLGADHADHADSLALADYADRVGAAARDDGTDRSAPVGVASVAYADPVARPVPAVAHAGGADAVDAAATPRTGGSESRPAAAELESGVRAVAEQAPDRGVHLDAPANVSGASASNARTSEFSGTLSDALDLIDREHGETLAGSKLYQVAANCFLSLGE